VIIVVFENLKILGKSTGFRGICYSAL